MSKLKENKEISWRPGDASSYPMKAGTIIYKGSLVTIDESGYAVPADDAENHKFVGVAQHKCDNNDGNDGDMIIKTIKRGIVGPLCFSAPHIPFGQVDVGKKIYISDSATVSLKHQSNFEILAGVLDTFISKSEIYINLFDF